MLNLRGLRQLHHQFEITDRSDRFSGKMSKTSEKNKTAGFATQSARRQRGQGKKLGRAVAQRAIGLLALGMSSAIAMQCDSLWNSSASRAFAQIQPDGTANTIVNGSPSLLCSAASCTIQGGTQVGNNLFHSFSQFSVPAKGLAFFNNLTDIQNIISRVTGPFISNIDGTLRANAGANLFLLNPNGIIFGPNASLNIGGSFVASTASSLKLSDGSEFSAVVPTPPLLTISTPLGLQFGANPGNIEVNGSPNPPATGLTVQPGKALALVGGNVSLTGGVLRAPGGRIELGGLAGTGLVTFSPDDGSLIFPDGVGRADVSLTQDAIADVVAGGGGDIGIYARNVTISGSVMCAGIGANASSCDTPGSAVGASNAVAGNILFDATGAVSIRDSRIENNINPDATGNAGNIFEAIDNDTLFGSILINAGSFELTDGSVSTSSFGTGSAGVVFVRTDGSAVVENSEIASDTYATDKGDAGGVLIDAGSILLSNSTLSSSTYGPGIAGAVAMQADGAISIVDDSNVFSNVESGSTGTGGEIIVAAGSFSLLDGSQMQTLVRGDNNGQQPGNGNAGNVTIGSNNTITIAGTNAQGQPSAIFSSVGFGATGNAGNIALYARSISLTNQGKIDTSISGTGQAGNIFLQATDSVSLSNGARIESVIEEGADAASTGGNPFAGNVVGALLGQGGDINGTILIASGGKFSLTDNALLNTSTLGNGNAGAVVVVADQASLSNGGVIGSIVGPAAVGTGGAILMAVGSLNIKGSPDNVSGMTTSTVGTGQAGLILAIATGDITLTGNSGIGSTAEEGAIGNGGGVFLQARTLSIKDGAEVSVSNNNLNSGVAGDLIVEVRDLRLEDEGKITATTLSGDGGNISIDARDLLVLTNTSNISTQAGRADAGGNGGNIGIKTQYIFAAPVNDSNIVAQAYTGNGGSIGVTAAQLYKIAPRPEVKLTNDIDASSQYGQDGLVTTNVLNVDPTQGLNSLSENPVDASRLIAQQCAARSRESGQENKFTITGRGGIPTNPNNTLQNESVVTDWVGEPPQENPSENNHSANPERSFSTATNAAKPSELVEAQGWVIGEKGEIILTANAPTVIPHDLKLTPAASCHGS
ncbi:MAG TPA: filamentous hemagglutinin N-terminal domain-containing protein [Allocoleopsis sp.]